VEKVSFEPGMKCTEHSLRVPLVPSRLFVLGSNWWNETEPKPNMYRPQITSHRRPFDTATARLSRY